MKFDTALFFINAIKGQSLYFTCLKLTSVTGKIY